jgi:hypothetical protein
MKRALMTAAIAVLLAGGAMAGHQASAGSPAADSPASGKPKASEWRSQECRFGGLTKGGWAQREVVLTIECAVRKWPVSGGVPFAVQVAACESGLRADASNDGRYLGVYQHAASYWPSRRAHFNPGAWDKALDVSAFNARSNVVVAIRMAHSGGWGPWSCA